ncbi:hypothetical protein BP5796_09072 [Coleophoma crateriformis]|uniref:NACHT-NTPase and P-loop NTPases N-terminal domain-containing protein n=1 Tax=Coleophoma crateriformis TaxID=565419 RepID=A0A3D8R2Z4_9HELO|nr:hypothetical protein BP5796_09072 [Coleophoma crateriformis]
MSCNIQLKEILGVSASAAQLLDCSIKLGSALKETIEVVKNGPKGLRARSRQVSHLINTADVVKSNENLHTPLVHGYLKAVLAEANSLLKTLVRAILQHTTGPLPLRLWRAFRSKQGRSILEAFDRLEREEVALILCINNAPAATLPGVSRSIDKMAEANSGETGVASPNEGYSSNHDAKNLAHRYENHDTSDGLINYARDGTDVPPELHRYSNMHSSPYSKTQQGSRAQLIPSGSGKPQAVIKEEEHRAESIHASGNSDFLSGDDTGRGWNQFFRNLVTPGNSYTQLGSRDEAASSGRHACAAQSAKDCSARKRGRVRDRAAIMAHINAANDITRLLLRY